MKRGNMKKIWSMSTFRLLLLVVAVVIPLNILTLILSSTTVREVEWQISTETRNALKLYMNQIDGAIERITTKMHLLAVEDLDFANINNREITDRKEYYKQLQNVTNLQNTFGDILQDHSLVTGLYAINPDKEFDIIYNKNYYLSYRHGISDYIREFSAYTDPGELRKWKLIELEETGLLIFVAKHKKNYYGAWFELSDLARQMNLTQEDLQFPIILKNEDGSICNLDSIQEDLRLVRKDARYMLIEDKSSYADLYIARILTKGEITSALPAMIKVLQTASFLALAILPLILYFMQKWMIYPMRSLTAAMEEIEAGNMDFRIREPGAGAGSEFAQINHNFNHMMDEVSRLKIDVYEEKLEKQKIRMRFLSQQIQPHFILNTMNILYSYEQEEYPLIQKMILCLAKYFRYIVNANADFVLMHEELDHIRNYFEIQQLRYPKTFFTMVEYDEEIADCLVPPLIIQNFAENAIKHSIKIGNKIDIFIVAQKYGEDAIRIRMLDTGEGMNAELIKKVRRFQETGEYQEGLGLGIQNAIERLGVLYGVQTKCEITRDEPHGTRIEMILPLYHAEGEEED
ncbi:MAG: histidine kinase [Eubacterium sp.]|nr:histidine kinase [Eubacterium sp.]